MTRALAMSALFASACSVLTPKADPTRYFVLTANEGAAPVQSVAVPIGLDHIVLPEYLVRDEMVMRKASNQIDIQDYNRWGEPLKDGFVRTLRRDLEGQLGVERVLTPPFDGEKPPALLVDLEIRHFEFVSGQGAKLEATWTLRDKARNAVTTRESKQTAPAPDGDVGAEVAALSKTIAGLASEIGEAVRASKLESKVASRAR